MLNAERAEACWSDGRSLRGELCSGTISGVDVSKFSEELAYLVDEQFTADDLLFAASFLAAATDKTVPISVDKVAPGG